MRGTFPLHDPGPVEPFLCCPEAREAGHLGRKIDVLPFAVEARTLERLDPVEQVVDEPRDAPVPVVSWGPVVSRKQGWHGNRRYAVALLDEIGIVGRLQLRR